MKRSSSYPRNLTISVNDSVRIPPRVSTAHCVMLERKHDGEDLVMVVPFFQIRIFENPDRFYRDFLFTLFIRKKYLFGAKVHFSSV